MNKNSNMLRHKCLGHICKERVEQLDMNLWTSNFNDARVCTYCVKKKNHKINKDK